MLKRIFLIFILSTLIFLLCGCSKTENKNKNLNTYNNTCDPTILDKNSLNIEIFEKKQETVESEIANFSTTIKSKSSGRLNNIRITCSKINTHVIENGSEFSFESIIGKSSPEAGYQKADIFLNGKIVQAYGGGNCQVSSTLYNAVILVNGLLVTERHKHKRRVDYVPEGMDAAVSYGTSDFRFKNECGYKIKIYATSDDNNLNIKIVKLE